MQSPSVIHGSIQPVDITINVFHEQVEDRLREGAIRYASIRRAPLKPRWENNACRCFHRGSVSTGFPYFQDVSTPFKPNLKCSTAPKWVSMARLFQAAGRVVPFSEFKSAFGKRVEGVSKILAMMSPWQEPTYIQRVWCVFEFSHAMAEKKAERVAHTHFRSTFRLRFRRKQVKHYTYCTHIYSI